MRQDDLFELMGSTGPITVPELSEITGQSTKRIYEAMGKLERHEWVRSPGVTVYGGRTVKVWEVSR